MAGYAVIGDVHGNLERLIALLVLLGYRLEAGTYRHPEGRVALFVGDLIDRGPAQVEVLRTVRAMVDAGSARVVMGNHELNAIGFATKGPKGYLRPHSDKNEAQHRAFLQQVGWDSDAHRELIRWFMTLPVALDLGGLRVCHAWWHDPHVSAVGAASAASGRLDEDFLRASFTKGSDAFEVLEGLTKGLEVELPEGVSFRDHGGFERREVRVRWWDANAVSFREAAIVPEDQRAAVPDLPLPPGIPPGNPSPVPVFVGHYWFTGTPAPQNANTAVLDYGAGLDGPLVGYRWNTESELQADHFVVA